MTRKNNPTLRFESKIPYAYGMNRAFLDEAPIILKMIGKGSWSSAFSAGPVVYVITNDRAKYLMARTKVRDAMLPSIKIVGRYTEGGKQLLLIKMPFYKSWRVSEWRMALIEMFGLLRLDLGLWKVQQLIDNPELAKREIWASTDNYSVSESEIVTFLKKIKKALKKLKIIFKWVPSATLDLTRRNLASDSRGRLILLDPVFIGR